MTRPPDNGLLVVLEGIDGVGKSTLGRLLSARLGELGFAVVASREPTDGPHGRRLRDSATLGRLGPAEELAEFIADRRQHVAELILPALQAGRLVLLDRYYFSTAAYQGARGLDWRELLRINEEFAPEPDLLALLELAPEESLRRITRRGDAANEFEQLAGLRRVAEIFSALDHPSLQRYDALRSPETIRDEVVLDVLDRAFTKLAANPALSPAAKLNTVARWHAVLQSGLAAS